MERKSGKASMNSFHISSPAKILEGKGVGLFACHVDEDAPYFMEADILGVGNATVLLIRAKMNPLMTGRFQKHESCVKG